MKNLKNMFMCLAFLSSSFIFGMEQENKKIKVDNDLNGTNDLVAIIGSIFGEKATLGDLKDRLIKFKLKVNETKFHLAAATKDFNKMKELLSQGINIDCLNENGNTALIALLYFGNCFKEGIEFLIDNGADINAKNKDGKTALDIALNHNDNEIVNILKLAHKNKFLIEKLVAGIETENEQVIKYLLVRHPDLVDLKGNNALHIAAKMRNKKMFMLILVIKPVLLKASNKDGLTAVEAYPEMLVHLILDKKVS